METLHTNISAGYVPDWGFKEGIRELMQNSLDAHDRGNRMGVVHIRKEGKLVIYNQGASIARKDLLLGSTSKAEDETQRGKYGEGFKLGSLALARAGKPVTIYNDLRGVEIQCSIGEHAGFGGEKVLTFITEEHKTKRYKQKLAFVVGNVSPGELRDIKHMFLSMHDIKDKYHKTKTGKILLQKELKGHVYVGGIYVTTDKELEYGYDFNPSEVKLNRDRNMVESFSLKWNTSKMWAFISANKAGKLFDATAMLKKGSPDVEYMNNFADTTIIGKAVEEFQKADQKAYPVTSNGEAKEVASMGYTPVYSSAAYTSTLRSKLGSVEELKRTVGLEYEVFRQLKLTDEANLQWVCEMLFQVDTKFTLNVSIVRFTLESTRSLVKDGVLYMNANLLDSKYELLHEAVNHLASATDSKVTHVWKTILRKSLDSREHNGGTNG